MILYRRSTPYQVTKCQVGHTLLEIHGGPHAAYAETFSIEAQLMAAKGDVIVQSNPRGSSSYGEDFGNQIHHNYPSKDYNDLLDVIDASVVKGFIDDKNLFITGGSGGVLTVWSIGKTNRFAKQRSTQQLLQQLHCRQ